ncbi:hypothetical protein Q2841_004114 [Escherichia coli]|uniref:hypothetical protein n=1 Tax=Escherichia coli TaxID=562 RepID=UPI000B493D04|nr:hypothetical protein [Escherichia coli]ATY22237.1 hypothetical protein AM344_26615 [Escherichia coli]EET5484420.1 hypothetical protein [Escherichia coli]EET6534688.1 hypothetical protein [Escherichia coli]EET7120157.1 hypothetical protein [Escherichia coli]EET7263228.1 hypothetical protein [Escherichia coli]
MKNSSTGVCLAVIVENQTIEEETRYKKIMTFCKYILCLLLILFPVLYDLWELLSTILAESKTVEEQHIVFAFGLSISGYLLIFIMIFTVIYRRDRKKRSEHAEITMAYKETEQNKELRNYYNRLRYVENSHIIFDPVTTREVSIKRDSIVKYIHSLHEMEHNKNMREAQ